MGQSKSKHILLVEDYDPVRELIANMLEDRSYRVSTVPAGASMRDFLRADDRVDAIVLNTVTPGENGASLARHAKDLGLPVVMISGSNDEISFAAEHGFSSFANRLRRRSSTARSTGRSLAASSASGAHDGSVEGRQNRKFIQALTLLEFLADPRDYRKFEDVKKIVARYVATTREEYARILERFLELTGKKDPTTQLFIGYHTRIIHIGERLDTIIPNPDNRRNVFEELDGHIRSIIDHMIAHSQLDFAEYLELRDKMRPFES